mmetsp:Transcript_2908/g.6861  ORF Transcript_2908/g.6861 Transcript_2908/m.6861 type:complete len:274 (-) Transcript_2908:425-1246(-)|eukprot:CAMPEP_0116101016 /NCGR_PEP_ID=MMETSP0327-20121206/12587_1 /TAXON_ID=44447 /ORGANISM="Pseudo-nitzschia delicatissima, Strain B596" /LENGTH=273 /DNA_ID=CAMNT_0003592953 /DNA_START=225 /DNA_END=1046 /DNA_ORIENTATION=-
MSFQDVGKRNSNRQAVSAAMGPSSSMGMPSASSASAATGNVFASMSISASTATSQISDSLTQYHRNVGILEKIAQPLLTNNGGRNRAELEQQYKAQSDVLRQLESRLKDQILGQRQRIKNQSQTSSHKQALLKLERDFEKVQASVTHTKSRVQKQMKQYQQMGSAKMQDERAASSNNSARTALEQQQILIQRDQLQQEIMREREDEIRKINKGMHQVNQIYKDLAHIVGEQQEHVDQIEDKMEESKTAAQSGLDQIHKANEKYGSGAAGCAIM